ncbi:MAG: substrate-binding domain-containing protein [Rhodospirillales bacterium]|nr:substrate-binding domain-containing protein [Rhodospirillales bacterium]
MNLRRVSYFLMVALIMALPSPSRAAENFFILASTTSTVNSGLFKVILPQFGAKTGIQVRVVGVGTGQAIRTAERGDADVLLVHHQPSEIAFVKNGFGVQRFDVMYNDFVVVGPANDPAAIGAASSAADAYKRIAASNAVFISRGDDSGTHKKSLEIWKAAEINAKNHSGKWYREAGAGMGAALNIARATEAYTLSDRATFEAFKTKGNHRILFQGGKDLRNQYGIILVNPARHKHVKVGPGQKFIKWILSATGQAAINAFRLNGKQVFFANAGR